MRVLLSALVATCVISFFAVHTRAADTDSKTVTGILIDNACAGSMMKDADPEKAASAHPKACAMRDSCEKSGYCVISGKEQLKFDDNGNKLAKDFLAKTDKTDNLKVTVEGTKSGDTFAVTSLKAAE